MLVKTDLGVTQESARRLRFEPASGISATDVQKAIEEAKNDIPVSSRRTVTDSGDVTLLTSDVIVFLDKDAGTINLPASAAWNTIWASSGFELEIYDVSHAASSNIQTITPNGSEKINGVLATLDIDTDDGSVKLRPDPNGTGWLAR